MMGFARVGGVGRGMLGFGALFMGLLCLLFFVALILWIIRMATWRRHGMGCRMGGMYGMHDDHGPMHGKPDEALDILRGRFARGDITKEEYEERLKILNGDK
jgi:putative membrane protein